MRDAVHTDTDKIGIRKAHRSPTFRNEITRPSIWPVATIERAETNCGSKYAILIALCVFVYTVPTSKNIITPWQLSPREDSTRFTVLCRIARNCATRSTLLKRAANHPCTRASNLPDPQINSERGREQREKEATGGLQWRSRFVQTHPRDTTRRPWTARDTRDRPNEIAHDDRRNNEDECLSEWVDREIASGKGGGDVAR